MSFDEFAYPQVIKVPQPIPTSYTKISFRYFIKLNIKANTMKLLQENIGIKVMLASSNKSRRVPSSSIF